MAVVYPGNKRTNVNKDAKYTIRHEDGEWVVKLVFTLGERLRTILANDAHGPLVDMVNEVKLHHNGQEGGSFYINEYRHVLVPTEDGILFAGDYDAVLEFDFEGALVTPRAPDDLEPGDVWSGPRVGLRHKLKATMEDITFDLENGNQTREVFLSEHVGSGPAASLASRLGKAKGDSGRIYINECGEFFGPAGGTHFPYFGSLGEDPWFPVPEV